MILRSLSFDSKDRFQNAREFGDALARELTEDTATFEPREIERTPIPATQLATDADAPARQTADLSAKTLAARFEPARVDTLGAAAYTPADSPPASRSWIKVLAGIVVLTVIVGAALFVWKRGAGSGVRQQTLAYSLTVQKMRDGKPYQNEFESSGQEIFENGWKFRMNLNSPNEGYLYLLNEGPADEDAVSYNMLFPEAKTNNGSPRVTADQKVQTAWMRFDDHQGTEKFWIVYSGAPVKELEAVTDKVNDRDQGAITDPAQARALRDFLQKHSTAKPEVTKDSAKKQTTVEVKGDLLVNFIELEHH